MQGRTEGYVEGIDYIRNFYREMAPAVAAFSLVLKGWRPPPALMTGRFDYAEPGCGYGLTSALLAATHPQARFTALDFNPAHIAAARRLAEEAGLGNVTFLEESFADHARRDGPDFDMVALHGVWSWVSAENRVVLVDLLRQRLRPGGVLYISYNALPGNLVYQPLRRILMDRTASRSGPLVDKIADALEFAARAAALHTGAFESSDKVAKRIETLRSDTPNYVVHEFLNADWNAFYHADVARELAAANLSFAAPAVPMKQFEELMFWEQVRALAADVADPDDAETLRDILSNRSFRRDLYVRGAERLTAAERTRILRAMRFMLLVVPDELPEVATTPVGVVRLPPALYQPLGEALAGGPCSLGELLDRPELAGQEETAVLRALALLVSQRLAAPVLPDDGLEERQAQADRCNTVLLDRRCTGEPSSNHLASPLLGSGIPLSREEALFVTAGRLGEDPAGFARRHLKTGSGGTDSEEEEALAALRNRHARFAERRLPVLRSLGVA